MAQLELTQGKLALVDDEDYECVSAHKWYAEKSRGGLWYAARAVEYTHIRMHTVILGVDGGIRVDHRDGDGLNNRRNNLRIATNGQNVANQHTIRGTSRYRGVHWDKHSRKWSAKISVHGVTYYLGQSSSEEEAALWYNDTASAAFGEFATINRIGESSHEPT